MSAWPGPRIGAHWAPSSRRCGCRAPSDVREEVVGHPPPTGVSNPNATSERGDAAPAVGMFFVLAESSCFFESAESIVMEKM